MPDMISLPSREPPSFTLQIPPVLPPDVHVPSALDYQRATALDS
jgi:hypothetical protein